jgi:hypothetical protein
VLDDSFGRSAANEKRGIPVAAAALEQSMLESKDKDTLLEMAKALGVKVTARQKKSEIIDKILDTTGPSSAPAPSAESTSGNGQRAQEPSSGDSSRTAPETTDRAATTEGSAEAPSVADAGEVVLGPDGEPLADWEIELARSGASAESEGTDAERSQRTDANRTNAPRDRNRGDQQRVTSSAVTSSAAISSAAISSAAISSAAIRAIGTATPRAAASAPTTAPTTATTTATTSRVTPTADVGDVARVAAARRARRARTSS